jgi:hypothetical protein
LIRPAQGDGTDYHFPGASVAEMAGILLGTACEQLMFTGKYNDQEVP